MGLIDVNFWPLLLFTHSLLMKRPMGWMYFLPLGAVSSTERSDILMGELLKARQPGFLSVMRQNLYEENKADERGIRELWPRLICWKTEQRRIAGRGGSRSNI